MKTNGAKNNFGRFNGQTLTFKQIIDSFKVAGLIECFTSNLAGLDLDKDEDVNNPYPAPISFYKFVHQGVYEPVDENSISRLSSIKFFNFI